MFTDAFGLFYDLENNVFMDEGGFIVWSIFDYITPNDLILFRETREYMAVPMRTQRGVLCELFWPTDDEEYKYES